MGRSVQHSEQFRLGNEKKCQSLRTDLEPATRGALVAKNVEASASEGPKEPSRVSHRDMECHTGPRGADTPQGLA